MQMRVFYVNIQDIPDDVKAAICKDVPRSFPEYTFFEDAAHRADLENILSAYAACDPAVGYCQGLNFLTGCILLYSPVPEEAFATLHLLLVGHGMRVLFLPDFKSAQVGKHTCRVPAGRGMLFMGAITSGAAHFLMPTELVGFNIQYCG
jgi:hypothetical protein